MHPDRLARIPKGSRSAHAAQKAAAAKTEAPKTKTKPEAEEPKAPKKSLFDNDGDESDDDGGVQLKVNEEYAKRFEHNKKREERQRRMFTPVSSVTYHCTNTGPYSRGEVQEGWRRRIRLGLHLRVRRRRRLSRDGGSGRPYLRDSKRSEIQGPPHLR